VVDHPADLDALGPGSENTRATRRPPLLFIVLYTYKTMKNKSLFIFLTAGLSLGIHPGEAAENPLSQKSTDLPAGNKLDMRQGLKVYKSACAQCHATGKNGAPRLHDKEAWKDRSFQSFSVMENHAKNGFLMMPPRGKRPALTDQEMANAVFYMTEQIKAREKP
jgi:cytochrome c5